MGVNILIPILTLGIWGSRPSEMSQHGPASPASKRKAPELIGRYNWENAAIPINGTSVPFAAPFDKVMSEYLREAGAPGGTLTVYYKGKKVYSKGFGYADVDKQTPFTPHLASRISSLSKFFTKEAVESLLNSGLLGPEDKVLPILAKGGFVPITAKGHKPDPRLESITIQQLLDHKSGLQAGLNISECTSDEIIKEMGFHHPITSQEAIGCLLGLPLESDPGKEENYSNYGYALLGKVIQIVTKKPYNQVINELVLKPKIDPSNWFVATGYRKDKRAAEPDYYSTRNLPTWDAFRWDIFAGAGGWVAPSDEVADYFQKRFPGKGWQYTLFGSYIGAVTVMRVQKNSLVYAASINYRRGNDSTDNEELFKRLEDASKKLNLP